MSIDTSKRSNEAEAMDDFHMEGEILRDALDKIASINRLLGGNNVTLNGVDYLLKDTQRHDVIRILDVGCGNGDMLRTLSLHAKKRGYQFQMTGIDANDFTIQHAKSLTVDDPNIQYRCADVFEDIKAPQSYDIILCTLTLHHFKDEEIITLLRGFNAQARLGIVINDLHRTAVAYQLFRVICWLFGLNAMSRDDGLVSILRGFKAADLDRYAKELNFKHHLIRWKWAFRYQWIIKNS